LISQRLKSPGGILKMSAWYFNSLYFLKKKMEFLIKKNLTWIYVSFYLHHRSCVCPNSPNTSAKRQCYTKCSIVQNECPRMRFLSHCTNGPTKRTLHMLRQLSLEIDLTKIVIDDSNVWASWGPKSLWMIWQHSLIRKNLF